MSISGERRKYFKTEAKSLLRYNYPKQIFMTGIIILLTFGLNAIKTNIIKLFGLEYSFYSMPVNMFFDLTSLFITLPLYIGIIYVNIKLFEGENVSVGGMFYYFSSSANMLDCYKFITALAARFTVFVLPFLLIGALFPAIKELLGIIFPSGAGSVQIGPENMPGIAGDLLEQSAGRIEIDIAMICAGAIYITAFFICAVAFMKYFAAVFIFVKNPCLNAKDIIRKSVKIMKKRKFEAMKLLLSFSLWIVISHYLAGFLYIFFTLPYIMLSYASFSSFLLSEKGGDEFLTAAYDYINEHSYRIQPVEAVAPVNSIKFGIPDELYSFEEQGQVRVKRLIRGRIFSRFRKITKAQKKQIG